MVRDNRIDVVRCFANYIIILLHAGAAFQYCVRGTLEYIFWTYLCWDLCSAALPAMFLISGFLLFQKYGLASFKDKLKRRVKRLAVPYFAWNMTFVVFYLMMARFVPRLSARVATFEIDTVQGIVDKTCSLVTAPIDGPLWFLRTLFIFTLCSPILWLFLRSKVGRWMGLGGVLIAYPMCYALGLTPEMALTYPLYALTIFYVGGLMAVTNCFHGAFEWFTTKAWILLPILGALMCGYVVALKESPESCLTALISDLGKLAFTPLLFIAVNQMNVNKISSNGLYQYMKEMSFFAYAGHFLFCSMIMHTAAPFLGFMTTGKFTVLVLIFCGVGVPVMAGIYWIGKKYLPRIMKIYDGTL